MNATVTPNEPITLNPTNTNPDPNDMRTQLPLTHVNDITVLREQIRQHHLTRWSQCLQAGDHARAAMHLKLARSITQKLSYTTCKPSTDKEPKYGL
jgi:hypothetical protein